MARLVHEVMSRPVGLEWLGWRTDTFTLQRAGWQLSTNQNIRNNHLEIAIQHPDAGVKGMSRVVDFHFMDPRMLPGLVIPIHLMGSKIHITAYEGSSINDFRPMDAQPMWQAEREVRDLDDFKIFRELPPDAPQEFYLEQASMAEILEAALSKQESKQAEIRARMLRDEKVKQLSDVTANLRLIA